MYKMNMEDDNFDDFSLYASQALQEMERLRLAKVRDSINLQASILSSFENKFSWERDNSKINGNRIIFKESVEPELFDNPINNDEFNHINRCFNLINQHSYGKVKFLKNEDLNYEESFTREENEDTRQMHTEIENTQIFPNLNNENESSVLQKKDNAMIEEESCEIEDNHIMIDKDIEISESEASYQKISENNETNILRTCICDESFTYYKKLSDNLEIVLKKVDKFITNKSLKKFILDIKIAINTPINALSSLNAHHMQDKYNKIVNILRGQYHFSCNTLSDETKDLCFYFCIDYMCRKFIGQTENLISKKPEDAFSLASIIVALWTEFPDMGPILLAYFMKKCPYIIPAYWPQFKEQSDKDYYLSLGYCYKNNDTIEDQNSFLKRMSGIFMLYVAIIVSTPRQNKFHPHGLRYAWRWIAAIINLEPSPDITATLIHEFLKIAGFKMSHYYGKQFWKIIYSLSTDYYKKIEKVTSVEYQGPIRRLKDYLEMALRHGQFSEPEGILAPDFW